MRVESMSFLKRFLGMFGEFGRRIPADPGTHKAYLFIVGVMVIAPFFLTIPSERQSGIAVAGVQLPSTCPSQRFFHTQCPGCGLTHSFVQLTHGHLRDSIRWNRVGIPLFLYFLFQLVLRVRILARPETIHAPLALALQHYLSWGVAAMLMLNWVTGLWLGSNGS